MRNGTDHLRRRIVLHRFERRHAQRFQRLEPRFKHRILVHAVGMKLLEDPFLQADLLHARDVAGPRPKGQAIQRVQDLIVFGKLLLEELAIVGGLWSFLGLAVTGRPKRIQHSAGARKVLLVFMSL